MRLSSIFSRSNGGSVQRGTQRNSESGQGGTQQAQPVAREALLKHAGGKAASKTSTRASKTSTRASGIASQQATPTNSEIQNSAGKGQLDFRTAYIRNELYLEGRRLDLERKRLDLRGSVNSFNVPQVVVTWKS